MASENHPTRWSGSGKRSVRVGEQAEQPATSPPAEQTPPEPPTPTQPPTPEEPSEQTAEGSVVTPASETVTVVEAQVAPQPIATDAARQLATKHNIDLATVSGTGAEGRITRDDVAALLPDASA